MSVRRTYHHLEGRGRLPSEYEIATSRLLYYPERGYAVRTAVAAFQNLHQGTSSLRCGDWDTFQDPRATTYTRYTRIQREKELFVDGLLRSIEHGDHDKKLDPRWLWTLERSLPVLLYPGHALQMISAYVGQMIPSGRVLMVSLFQAADEMRRVQRLAYRVRMLEKAHPGFGREGKAYWLSEPDLQPLRRLIETLLVTYDPGEAFVATNLVLKPLFDRFVTTTLSRRAVDEGDALFAGVLRSLGEDSQWHRDWAAALARRLCEETPDNEAAMRAIVRRFKPEARLAVQGLEKAAGLTRGSSLEETTDFDADQRELLTAVGLDESDGREHDQRMSLEEANP
jgi:toluene monooxygenase system protein E